MNPVTEQLISIISESEDQVTPEEWTPVEVDVSMVDKSPCEATIMSDYPLPAKDMDPPKQFMECSKLREHGQWGPEGCTVGLTCQFHHTICYTSKRRSVRMGGDECHLQHPKSWRRIICDMNDPAWAQLVTKAYGSSRTLSDMVIKPSLQTTPGGLACGFCHCYGHTILQCRKLKKNVSTSEREIELPPPRCFTQHAPNGLKESTCGFCHRYGHTTLQCRKLKKDVSTRKIIKREIGLPSPRCFTCNELGHKMRECPQLKSRQD